METGLFEQFAASVGSIIVSEIGDKVSPIFPHFPLKTKDFLHRSDHGNALRKTLCIYRCYKRLDFDDSAFLCIRCIKFLPKSLYII